MSRDLRHVHYTRFGPERLAALFLKMDSRGIVVEGFPGPHAAMKHYATVASGISSKFKQLRYLSSKNVSVDVVDEGDAYLIKPFDTSPVDDCVYPLIFA